MGRKFEIQRVANITAPDGTQPVFYEIWEAISVDGEVRLHRNADLAFRTKEEAEEWVGQNSDSLP